MRIAFMIQTCETILLQIIRTLHLPRGFSCLLDRWKQKSHEHSDDGDDDQKLNERESVPFSHFVSPSYFHYFNFSLPTVLSPIPRCIGERKRSAAVLLYRFIPRLFKTVSSFRGGEA